MFLKKSSSILAAQIVVYIVAFATSVVLARSLAPVGKGQLALLSTLTGIITLITSPGIGAASIYHQNRDRASWGTIAVAGILLQMGLTCAAVAAAALLIPWISQTILRDQVAPAYVLLSLLMLPFGILAGAIGNVFVGVQDMGKYNYTRLLSAVLQLALLLVLFPLGRINLTTAIVSGGMSLAGAAALGSYWLYRMRPPLKWGEIPRWRKPLLAYGLRAWVGNILQFFNYRLDVFIVNIFLGAASVGQYSVAYTLAESIWFIPSAASTVLFPRTAADWKAAGAFTPIVSRSTAFVTTLAALAMAIIAFPLITIVYGARFVGAWLPLLALLPGIVFLSVGKVLASDLAGQNKPQYGAWSAAASVGVTVALDFLLVPRMGPTGAGLASSISYGLSTAVLVYLYCRLTGNSAVSVLFVGWADMSVYRDTLRKYAAPLVERFAGAR
jgi:O-antigen/teichoic acid export membrane protein